MNLTYSVTMRQASETSQRTIVTIEVPSGRPNFTREFPTTFAAIHWVNTQSAHVGIRLARTAVYTYRKTPRHTSTGRA